MVLDDFRRQRQDVLALVVSNQGELLQDDDDVVGANARRVADFFDGH